MSKINDLLKNLGEPIDTYREWEVPKNYPFPVYRKQKGSLIEVYRLEKITDTFDNKNIENEKLVDDYQYQSGSKFFLGSLELDKMTTGRGKRKLFDSKMKGIYSKKRGKVSTIN